ncbi:MAG TPA: hypothetical protein VJU83_12890 [Burkholderiales bacterium]|nr:hypothetical protein [Burkholderiales bacterium]
MLWSSQPLAQQVQQDLQDLEFLKLSPAFNDYWTGYVRKFEEAAHQFRQAALQGQCDKITSNQNLTLNPEFRRAIESVMNSNRQLVNVKEPQTARHLNRFSLYALNRLNPSERASLLAFAKDKEVLKYVANLYVLEDFRSHAIEPIGGQLEPAAVVWLKTYFQKEGRLTQLNKAVNLAQPGLAAKLEQLQPLENYREADLPALSALTGELLQQHDAVTDMYAQQIPKAAVPRLQRFYAHPFHEWVEKARTAEGDPMSQALGKELPAELAGIREELKTQYPAPPALNEKLVRMGPYDYAGKQVERFCPKKAG